MKTTEDIAKSLGELEDRVTRLEVGWSNFTPDTEWRLMHLAKYHKNTKTKVIEFVNDNAEYIVAGLILVIVNILFWKD